MLSTVCVQLSPLGTTIQIWLAIDFGHFSMRLLSYCHCMDKAVTALSLYYWRAIYRSLNEVTPYQVPLPLPVVVVEALGLAVCSLFFSLVDEISFNAIFPILLFGPLHLNKTEFQQ